MNTIFIFVLVFQFTVKSIHCEYGDNDKGFPGTAELISNARHSRLSRDFLPAARPSVPVTVNQSDQVKSTDPPPEIRDVSDLMQLDQRNFSSEQKVLLERIAERVARFGSQLLSSSATTVNAEDNTKEKSNNLQSRSHSDYDNDNNVSIVENNNDNDIEDTQGRSHKKHSHRISASGSIPGVSMVPIKLKLKPESEKTFRNKTSVTTNFKRKHNKTNQKQSHSNGTTSHRNRIKPTPTMAISNNNNNKVQMENMDLGNISTTAIVNSLADDPNNTNKNGHKELFIRQRPSTVTMAPTVVTSSNNKKKVRIQHFY